MCSDKNNHFVLKLKIQCLLQKKHSNSLLIQPNHIYGIIAGSFSFWLPSVVMVYVYIRVYMEAVKLESLHCRDHGAITNLQRAQDNMQDNSNSCSDTVLSSSAGTQLLVRIRVE